MNSDDDTVSAGDDIGVLAEITEQITRRLESGEPIGEDERVAVHAARADSILGLLPTLRTMVSLGEAMAHEGADRKWPHMKSKRKPS
jgi:hypothetical protein